MTTKETKLRLDPALDEWLAAQAAITGIAKTKYIMQLLEDHRSAKPHTHAQISPSVSPKFPLDASLYAEVAALKSRVAKIEQGIPKSTQPIPKTIPSFEVGQVIDGQSNKTYKMLRASFEAEQKIDRTKYCLSNKLGVICKVIGTSRADKAKFKVWRTFSGDTVHINEDGTFLKDVSNGARDYFKDDGTYVAYNSDELVEYCLESGISAMAEATAAVEPVKGEVVADDVEMSLAPINEAMTLQETEVVEPAPSTEPSVRLTKDELLERFATKLNNPGQLNTLKGNLNSVGAKKLREKSWTAQYDPEGKVWIPTDETRAYWVELPMEVAS